MNTCATCDCYRRADDGTGECHRHAPRPAEAGGPQTPAVTLTRWPAVLATDGCGDWQSRPVGNKSPGGQS